MRENGALRLIEFEGASRLTRYYRLQSTSRAHRFDITDSRCLNTAYPREPTRAVSMPHTHARTCTHSHMHGPLRKTAKRAANGGRALTADEFAEFYAQFLKDHSHKHREYNMWWWKQV